MPAARKSSAPIPRVKRGGLPWTMIFIGLASVAALAGTYMLFVEPPPPRKLVLATGKSGGAYYEFGKQYAAILKKEGLTLEIRETQGSVENLKLLQDKNSGVTVALVQSGIADSSAQVALEALGSLYREPLWIFYRESSYPDYIPKTLRDLGGKRIAIGPEGSGTRAIALLLLEKNGALVPGPDGQTTALRDATGLEAAALLKRGDVDVAFFVGSIEAPYVDSLLQTWEIQVLPMFEQEAYLRRFRFLSGCSLPPGLLNLGQNIPDKEIPLVAPMATLVARTDLHPALVSLLLGAATKVHSKGDLLSRPDEFPSPHFTDLPLSEDAKRYYKSGPPVLQRILPFWLASLVDRLKVMLIPLIMLLMPLFRSAPPLMRWRTRRRIYRWYSALRDIDLRMLGDMSAADVEAELGKLRVIEEQIAHVEVPLSYMEEFYNLRLHLAMIREKLQRLE